MDSELQFAWPGGGHRSEDEWRPPEWLKSRGQTEQPDKPYEGALERKLAEAQEAIARLEADRRTARKMIEDLEAANDELHTRVTSQRRRMLLLERQLEDAEVMPAPEAANAGWLERLFGGFTSATTG